MSKSTESGRRLSIGLLVSNLEMAFDDLVCEGAMLAAEKEDVNLVIFPGRYINGVYDDKLRTEYEYQYNTVFNMAAENKFDVLLVLLGTIGSYLDEPAKRRFMQQFGDTPVMTIAAPLEGYPCISVDNRTGMKNVICHLIEEHGCRRIGFVSGPKTSADALERLDVYKEALEEHGIPYDESLVMYGNFSKYCSNEIGEFIDSNTGLEAIAFANDQMALAGYQAMQKRGIKPGKDILMTGFDNDPVSEELRPRLTTVESDASELGYAAVVQAVKYIRTGSPATEKVPTSAIFRESCGCVSGGTLSATELPMDSELISEQICDFLLSQNRSSSEVAELRRQLKLMLIKTEEAAESSWVTDKAVANTILELWNGVIDMNFLEYVNIYQFCAAIDYHQKNILAKKTDYQEKEAVMKFYSKLCRAAAEKNSAYYSEKLDDVYFLTWQTNAITRDMLVFEAYDDRSYHSVVDKLTRLHVISSYLYSYDRAVINLKTDRWRLPEDIKLKAYHNRGEAMLLPPELQGIKPDELFTNPYLPRDRRYTMIASAIFSNEEHFGILLCEVAHKHFDVVQSITGQLCASLKIITMMKQQEITQRQLRQSLMEIKENNQLLSDLSKSDELTGCFNRRGFFEEVRKKLNEREGADGIMVFADLDSLKTINDRFGHEDGDYAIRSAAKILKSSFGGSEIIGRIGGDEFVVCAFPEEPVPIDELRERIEKVTDEYNREHGADKPYVVHTSIGAYPFKCTENVEIGELLSHADEMLYEQKKNKKSILKSERNDL